MTCYYPNAAYVTGKTVTGKRAIQFKKPDTFKEKLKLPCGQCLGCRLDHSQQWAVRIMHEAQMNDDNIFITLTYNEKNLPHDKSLVKSHFQKFMKRLRKQVQPEKIRYYHCGEYGDENQRPHYHAILFNYLPADGKLINNEIGREEFHSEKLENTWGKGYATYGFVTLASAAYVARYILKKITGDRADAHYETIQENTGEIRQKEPEYSTMSRKPGIAKDWYDKYQTDIFPSDECIHKGKKVKTPRFYETQLERSNPELLREIKARRKEHALKHKKDYTPRRLRDRETCKIAQIKNLARNL